MSDDDGQNRLPFPLSIIFFSLPFLQIEAAVEGF
jgi:hypothetical protein